MKKKEQRFGKPLNEDVKMGVVLALAQPEVQKDSHIPESHTLVKKCFSTVTQHKWMQALVRLGKRKGRSKKSNRDKKRAKARTGKARKGTEMKTKKTRAKAKPMPQRLNTLLDVVSFAKPAGHQKKRISGGMKAIKPAASTKTDPRITRIVVTVSLAAQN